jgi:hypothetical protein
MTDEEILATAQQAAIAKMQARGLSSEQITNLQKSLAAPSDPHTITTADMEAAWRRSADGQLKSLGISPVTDAEAAKIQEVMDTAAAKMKAEQAAQMDQHLHNFRLEVEHNRAAKSGLYYSEDPAKMREVERLVRETEANMMLARLEAGLPAEPPPRKSPAQIAQERYDARRRPG